MVPGSREAMNPKEGRGEDAERRGCGGHARVPPDNKVESMHARESVDGIEDRKPKRLAVDLREAGAMLSVCGMTVKREIERGRLRGLKIGRVWRVKVSEIEAYLKRQER